MQNELGNCTVVNEIYHRLDESGKPSNIQVVQGTIQKVTLLGKASHAELTDNY